MWVHDLREADARCGGKAVGLSRLIAAGLDVPPGFAIAGEAFASIVGGLVTDAALADTSNIGHVLAAAAEAIAQAEIPAELEREVRERARELGSLVAVRSSATIEDTAAGAAAGVFSSRRAVPVADVWDAIRTVWTSALTPLAAAYARKRGGSITIGVIVQEYVSGTPLVVYTRPPGQPASSQLLIQRSDHVSRHARDDLPREIEAQHAALLALRAEHVLGIDTGVDVELVQVRKQSGFDVAIETVIVQARPVIHPTAKSLVPAPPAVLAPLQDGRTWTWDVAHNPDPLSLAQQGLVERVDAAGTAPWSLRVCAGFLYSASRGEPPTATPSLRELQLRAAELGAQLEVTLRHDGVLPVAEAIERYLAFYAIWARELSPLIAAARRALPDELRRLGHDRADAIAAEMIGARESAVEAALFAGARGELDEREVEQQLGCLSVAWDVSVATFGEQPGLLRDAVARAATAAARDRSGDRSGDRPGDRPGDRSGDRPGDRSGDRSGDPGDRRDGRGDAPETSRLAAELTGEIELARQAAALAEHDDVLFARAQRLVRRALLARGESLGLRRDDVFWLPLDEVAGASSMEPIEAHRRAAAARAAAERAAQWQMPIVVGGELPAERHGPLRGHGTGARVAGRVVRFASLASAVAVGAGDVVVTRAVTPALAVLVAGCAALVSETGGYLDHGAALARELGIPCVVGCKDAWARLTDGMLVTVDGDGGAVIPTT